MMHHLCQIVTWSECDMRDCPVECTAPEPVPRIFKKKVCNMVPHVITHTKMRPVCRNETKLNCITLWTMDAEGNKVCQNVSSKLKKKIGTQTCRKKQYDLVIKLNQI